MKISRIILVVAFLLGLTHPGWSQQANGAAGRGIPGYLDPRTGEFRPLAQHEAQSEEIEATTPTTGKFVVSFTITISSSIPTADTISCGVTATLFETSTFHTVEELASVAASRTGSTATCTVTLPYSWVLSTPSSDTVNLSYSITVPGTTVSLPSRTSIQTINGNLKVPGSGSTTNETVTATI